MARQIPNAKRIVDVLTRHVLPRRLARFETVLRGRVSDTTLVLENLIDDGNVSAIIRTAEALGLQDVHVIRSWGGANPGQKLQRSVSRQADSWLRVVHHESTLACFEHLKRDNFWIAATDLGPGSVDMSTAVAQSLTGKGRAGRVLVEGSRPYRPRVAVVVGNEKRGVSRSVASRADACFFIPQAGMMQSLNVSVAAGIALHAFLHRTRDCASSAVTSHVLREAGERSMGHGLVPEDETAEQVMARLVAAADGALQDMGRAGDDRVDAPLYAIPAVQSLGHGQGHGNGQANGPGATQAVQAPTSGYLHPSSPPAWAQLRTERLSDDVRLDTLARWLVRQVPQADSILDRAGIRPEDL